MTAGSYTARDVVVSVELPDGRIVHPVAFDTDAFLRARIASTYQAPDGSAHNAAAEWWPEPQLGLGATWWVVSAPAWLCEPAVVDDFGDLVLVGWRL